MFLAKVIGQVVSTKKHEGMTGKKLLLLRPMLVDEKNPRQFRPGSNTVVAIDSVGAGEGEMVLFAQGSSARQAEGLKTLPIDAAIIGIVDSVDVLGHSLYPPGSSH
jgi:ethanolamine utilization protein EutN